MPTFRAVHRLRFESFQNPRADTSERDGRRPRPGQESFVPTGASPTGPRIGDHVNEITFVVPDGTKVLAISLWERAENAVAYNTGAYTDVVKILSKVVDGTPQR